MLDKGLAPSTSDKVTYRLGKLTRKKRHISAPLASQSCRSICWPRSACWWSSTRLASSPTCRVASEFRPDQMAAGDTTVEATPA